MERKGKDTMNQFLKIWLPIISAVFIVFYITSTYIEPEVEKKITIATGSKEGNYYKTALEYKKLLEQNNMQVTILNTKGSVENIELLEEGKADIAFVQSGIMEHKNADLYSLAALYYEPLWIFYKNEGFSINYIIHLIGKKIAIGEKGSGTEHLSKRILNDNGLNESNSTILNYNTSLGKEKLLNGQIDALFIVSSAKADSVKQLLSDPSINALSIKRSYAYDSKYSFLNALTLHEGTIDLYMNLPDEDKKLLTTTANLVANKNVNEELIRLVIKQAKKVHSHKGIFEKEFQFPNLNNLDSPIHPEAQRYFQSGDTWLEKIFPFWIASNIDRLKILLIPLLTLLFPLFKGVIPLYTLTMRSKVYKWYNQLNEIDININTYTKDELKQAIEKLDKLKLEVQEQTHVPNAFMGEYYSLIMHIDLIHNKAQKHMGKLN